MAVMMALYADVGKLYLAIKSPTNLGTLVLLVMMRTGLLCPNPILIFTVARVLSIRDK
jgi:hypothetical protein